MHDDKCGFPEVNSLRDLKVGEKRNGIQPIQNYLRRFGFLRGVEHERGTFDEPTSAAMQLLQRTWNIPDDGLYSDHTRELMVQPRCGMSDANVSAGFSINCGWAERTLRYSRRIGTPDAESFFEWTAFTAALSTWTKATGINFIPLNVGGHFEVFWLVGDDPDYDEIGPVLAHEEMAGPSINIAHADYPPGCSVMTDTTPKPVHFNGNIEQVKWTVDETPGAFDIETVALHQIGHILGFAHSADPNSVMYPFFSPGRVKRELTAVDRQGARLLYPHVPAARELGRANAAMLVWNAGLIPFFTGDDSDQSWVSSVSPQVGSPVSPNSTVTMHLSTGPIP